MTDTVNKEDFALFLEEIGVTQEQLDAVVDTLPPYTAKKDWEAYALKDSSIHGKGLFSTVKADPDCPLAILRVGDDWTEAGRYANHSGDPNCYAYSVGDTIMMIAYKPVTIGDELLVDYRDVKDALENPNSRVRVFDEFCPHIEDVVLSVKRAGFATWLPEKGKVGSSVYDGMGFWGNHALMMAALIDKLGTVVVPNSMFFRNTLLDTETAYIHSDRETGNHTCVAYLTDHEEEYGTAFYRHKSTGLLEMPSFKDQAVLGIQKELAQDMVERTPDKWETTAFVSGRFNRAVVFWAPLFHSRIPVNGFGTTEDEGRLIWASHFYKLKGSGELY